MKKLIALLLTLTMVLALAACGGSSAPAPAPQNEPAPAEQAPAELSAMDQLIADAQAEGTLVVYGSCEEEYLAAACQHFE